VRNPEQLAFDLHLPGATSRSSARWLAALLAGLIAAGAAIAVWPYRSSVAGVPFVASASFTTATPGLTLDTGLGAVQFREVTALPVGVRIAPRIDLEAVRAATSHGAAFTSALQAGLRSQFRPIAVHFLALALAGLIVGAVTGVLVVDGVVAEINGGAARQGTRRQRLGHRAAVVAVVTAGISVATAGTAALTYRSEWASRYSVTGVLADILAAPGRLAGLDARDSRTARKIRAVLSLEKALTAPAPANNPPPNTAFNIMFISDVHRRDIYPYLQGYIDAGDVRLIVDTGDETLFGSTAELTGNYLASIRKVTARTPMIWVKGNHDSPAIARAMAAIPGVIVLNGQVVTAYGLQIYGTADPRIYGAPGDLGSDDPATVTRVQTLAAQQALAGLNRSAYLDLLLAHEPIEADALASALGPALRAQASGHVHRQNPVADLQTAGRADIRLVEGSTGMGGLLSNYDEPMQLSILSVAADCQYTRTVRYTLQDPALTTEALASSFGTNSSFVVHYFRPQKIPADRTCSTARGIGVAVNAGSTDLRTVQEWGPRAAPQPTGTVRTPTPASSNDEAPDKSAAPSDGHNGPPPASQRALTASRPPR